METHASKLIWVKIIILSVILALFFLGCGPPQENRPAAPKYIFLFIGDGMGRSQITATEIYTYALKHRDTGFESLSFSDFPSLGEITTFSSNSYFTDSAASGTALASGYKTKNGKININEDGTLSFVTLAESAQAAGRKIGIISSVPLDHATPAGFYARVPYRWHYYDISIQMAECGFDFFGGGGLTHPAGMHGRQQDVREYARKQGYTIADTNAGFENLKPGTGKTWAISQILTRKNALPYEIDRPSECLSLADFTRKAISLLENENGFFIMAEGGKIDWACHDNDAASTIHEVLAFSDAVQEAVHFYHQHPDETLIVVTADHETGGMMLGSEKAGGNLHLNILSHQNMSLDQFNNQVIKPYLALTDEENRKLEGLYPEIQEKFGLVKLDNAARKALRKKALDGNRRAEEKIRLALSPIEWKEMEEALADPRTSTLGFSIVRILNEKAGISWGSYNHSASRVPVFAIGAGADQFEGSYDNTGIAKKLFRILGLPWPPPVEAPQDSAVTSSH